jgi:hypothetical protein
MLNEIVLKIKTCVKLFESIIKEKNVISAQLSFAKTLRLSQ